MFSFKFSEAQGPDPFFMLVNISGSQNHCRRHSTKTLRVLTGLHQVTMYGRFGQRLLLAHGFLACSEHFYSLCFTGMQHTHTHTCCNKTQHSGTKEQPRRNRLELLDRRLARTCNWLPIPCLMPELPAPCFENKNISL